MNICRATKRRGKYQQLFTDAEVNYCFSISTKPVDSEHQMTVGESADTIPSLSGQSERAKNIIYCFGLV